MTMLQFGAAAVFASLALTGASAFAQAQSKTGRASGYVQTEADPVARPARADVQHAGVVGRGRGLRGG